MPYYHAIKDVTPSPRATPWTGARIEESTGADGPWQTVETFPLTPLDPDPQAPATREFATSQATLVAGWLRVVFTDPDGGEEPTMGLFAGGPIAPAAQQVARFLRARATGKYGKTGVFTSTSNPTLVEVEEYIADATMDVIAEAGRVLPAAAQDLARGVITAAAAVLVEVNSEQVNVERLRALEAIYDKRLARLVEAAQDVQAGGDPGGVDDRPVPLGTFPCPTPLEW